MSPDITPGFLVLHSHRTERLAQTVAAWLAQHPLPPLQNEVVLVQSNGMAEWMKMTLAQQAGVCMATQVELPSRFLWRTYRQVLGAAQVPRTSPLDKLPMTWRLMRVLPTLLQADAFAPLQRYVADADPQRLLQLCAQLADLFDQYQNHRPDWLTDWGQGLDVLCDAKAAGQALPAEQMWQPQLWRAVLGELTAHERQAIRPHVHQKALDALRHGTCATPVAPRVVVFGMSHMPHALLDMLAALGAHSQVILAVPNPCQHDWSEVMDGREWWHRQQRRTHGWKGGLDLSRIDLSLMHLHANPLLAAWGRSARDFIRQLDTVDDRLNTQARFPNVRLDFFDDEPDAQPSALLTLQNAIRDLQTPPETPLMPLPGDTSLRFVRAHSPVRELEVLHDHLLSVLAQAPAPGQAALQPRDIVVMLPDVQTWAPAIRAVFGPFERSDKRYIPFDIADLSLEAVSPLVHCVDTVLTLPRQRLALSQLGDWLQLPALAARLGLSEEQVDIAQRWLSESGGRWGLHRAHREAMGLAVCDDTNTLAFGIERLLLGYATGPLPEDDESWPVAPFAGMGGLEAEVAGALAQLARTLDAWWAVATHTHTPVQWVGHAQALVDALLAPTDPLDVQVVDALKQAFARWQVACDGAQFEAPVTVQALRHGWHEALAMPTLTPRFRAGGVTFCTLMPMRAVPFEVVCLLGMNDGEYPRISPRNDFDLMQTPGQMRAGDRSRQHDDRLLMLEALMAARRQLYVSWQGQSVRDNSEQPPSVLVSQLRDHVAAWWGGATLAAWTSQHPLQPFSRRYFEADSPLHSHAHDWREALAQTPASSPGAVLTVPPGAAAPPTLTLARFQRFFRHPVQAYLRDQLGVRLSLDDDTPNDEETWLLDGLQRHSVTQAWIEHRLPQLDAQQDLSGPIEAAVRAWQRTGQWPLGGVGRWSAQQQQRTLAQLGRHWRWVCAQWPTALPPSAEQWHSDDGAYRLSADVDGWRQDPKGASVCVQVSASHLGAACVFNLNGSLSKKSRLDKLLRAWLHTLLLCACRDDAPSSVWVAPDAVLQTPGLPREQAHAHLHTWMAAWAQGQSQPLPLPVRTALAWVQGAEVALVYEGSEHAPGECDTHWQRVYPDAAALRSTPFEALAQDLYGPMLAWAQGTQVLSANGDLAP